MPSLDCQFEIRVGIREGASPLVRDDERRNLGGTVSFGGPVPDAAGSSSTRADLRTTPFAGRGAAADGSAPEGGTASSASAKVPVGRLAPRRPRTPTEEGIQRRGTCPGF